MKVGLPIGMPRWLSNGLAVNGKLDDIIVNIISIIRLALTISSIY